MVLANKVGVKGNGWRRNQQRGKHWDESDEEYKVSEDEDCDESDGYCSLGIDESEEEETLERVAGSRETRKISSVRKRNETKKPCKRRRVFYTGMDDDEEDEDEYMSLGRNGNQIKESQEKKNVSYIEEDDEDDLEFMSYGRKRNQIQKSRQNRISDTEGDDDDLETKEEEEEEEEEEEDYEDDSNIISGRKGKRTKKPWEKKKVSYTEDQDKDDAKFMSSSRKRNLVKKPWEKESVSCTEENDDEEDEGDQEFVLSESDFVGDDDEEGKDDEEFVFSESDFVDDDDDDDAENDEELKMKNKKVSRYPLHKRNSRRGQKTSRKRKVLKSPTRPKLRNQRSNRKISSRNKQLPRKKISNQRKRRVTAETDSDFVSSVSSDHEYTISEEEREQMREAKIYCDNLRSKLRNSSSRIQEPTFEQRKPPVRKGKGKVEDIKDEVGKQVCGICLSEEGKRTVRGVLNSCCHHFCFSCILEWSKVESRCPLCKQRFATITKASRSDTVFDSKTVVIPVPERDQVYLPSEEEVRGYFDPYESVICTECHNGGDDAFMLLCDICDSPAHTFCVGLGREVPDGNWYCNGCTTPWLSTNAGDFDLNEAYVPEIPSTQDTCILPEPNEDLISAATTLRDRRRIHRQIHHRLLNSFRLRDLIARPSGASASTSTSSAGIRLFDSHLDQDRDSNTRQMITHAERL